MKLLIIAGPYEADRIRQAAVAAGFEAAAIEPGESLSGWITASRPDLIVLAPQIISSDAIAALAKVRAVPRGRVPIFLVGDEEERDHLDGLADGFFVRPVAAEDLLASARAAVGRSGPRAESTSKGGTQASGGAGDAAAVRTSTLRPLVAAGKVSGRGAPVGWGTTGAMSLDPPEVAIPGKTADHWPPWPSALSRPSRAGGETTPAAVGAVFDQLTETIEADFEAEFQQVVARVAVTRQARQAGQAGSVGSAAARGPDERIRARHILVLDGDYFQILGVAPDATTEQIRDAGRRVTAELADEALPPATVAAHQAELEEIRAVVAEAVRLLSDEALCEQYRHRLALGAAVNFESVTP